MERIKLFIAALFAALTIGCSTTEKLAEGIATKNVTGNGSFFKTAIDFNAETKTPELSTIFVNGDYASSKSGTNSIYYRSESTGSVWNAKVTTQKQILSITLENGGNVADVIRAVSDVLRAAAAGEPVKEVAADEP